MVILNEIGLTESSPAETIVTSFSSGEEPHMAAIGVRKSGDNEIEMKIFPDTRTWKNLNEKEAGVVNIIQNAEFLVKQGLPDDFEGKEKIVSFEKGENVDSPYLSEADAIAEFEVIDTEKKKIEDEIGSSVVWIVTAAVKKIEILKCSPRPFKRSELYLIEAATLATKALEAQDKGNDEAFKDLFREIKKFEEKCEKIAPESGEHQLISKIIGYLGKKK